LPSEYSAPKHLTRPDVDLHAIFLFIDYDVRRQPDPVAQGDLPGGAVRLSGFAILLQVRQRHPAETASLTYGLLFCLELLSTPPHDDAVTSGYKDFGNTPSVDLHLADNMLTTCLHGRIKINKLFSQNKTISSKLLVNISIKKINV
jgi:hypothetical protein